MKVEAIEPHGFCAGVKAAIAKVRSVPGAYCLHAPVHSEIVVGELRALGHRIVDRIEDVPEGETVVFSAHGVPPSVREAAASRRLRVLDATCPFVDRVHRAARGFSDRGLPVVILGDPDHVEVVGIAGEVSSRAPRPGDRIGVVCQTTMDPDEVEARVAELRRAYSVEAVDGVCLATKERQDAVRRFCARPRPAGAAAPGVLVLGSRTSANSRRLAEVAAECGAKAFLAGSAEELAGIDFAGVDELGVTSGASTPESFFGGAMEFLRGIISQQDKE